MSAPVVAFAAASSLGIGRAAFDVGEAGNAARAHWGTRAHSRPFGRVDACHAAASDRPRALLDLGLEQLIGALDEREPRWRERRLGVVIGTSSGGFAALEQALSKPPGAADDWGKASYHAALAGLEQRLGTRPERLVSLYAACASSTLALGLGLRWLELQRCELVIAGGYDAESAWVAAGFDALKATASGVPRPFRVERDGMALGEGVALLALGATAHKPFGYVRGFGATTDAVHITAPDRTGQSLARAAQLALADARVSPADVRLVSAHGTGTSFNDAAEAAALSLVFGAKGDLVLHAFKPTVGHTLGAAGALESLSALSALERDVLPASASMGTPMPELSAQVLDRNQSAELEHCLKLSTAFGGANAALLLSKSPAPASTRARRAVHVAAVGNVVRELDVAQLASLLVAPLEKLPRGDELSSLSIAAAAAALQSARASGLTWNALRTGVIVGSVGASLEANAAFAARIIQRGVDHAEPRRFPATSPNACAGQVAIAFGLGGPSHAVGASAVATLEALEVGIDWLEAGDADALLVIGAEASGTTSVSALSHQGLKPPPVGAAALLLTIEPFGPPLDPSWTTRARSLSAEFAGFSWLTSLDPAGTLPGRGAFGSVRPPE